MPLQSRAYLYIFVAFFPFATLALQILNEENGLIWIFMDTIYFYPIYYAVPSLFEELEMGALVPSIGGRCLALVIYPLLVHAFFKLKVKTFD